MKRIILLVASLAFVANISFAQNQDAPGPERYVIVGVFRLMDNAVRFTEKLNKEGFSAGYIQNPRNKLYYVTLFQSTESKQAFAFMMKIRLETEYKEAWVYRGSLGAPITEAIAKKEEPKKEEPVIVKEEPKKEEPKVVEQPKVEPPKEEPKKEEPKQEEPKQEEPKVVEQPKVETPAVDSAATDPNVPTMTPTMEPKPVGKPFFFKLVSSETGEPVEGEIHILEPSGNASTFQTFPANQVVYLPAPRDPSQVYAVSTLAAGYQEMNRPLNYADPSASAAEVGTNEEFVIALPLVHVKMGDYIEFSQVRFFSNSVLLQPSSKEELDGLAELLKQNPRYKIAIHGHCNGDQDRNIIVRAPNADFFTASSGNQRRTVNAKEFTELRAELVKDYLIAQGVEGKRISTKGEGGKALIYPINSTLAGRNDRVEIEVKRGK
ncbi:MAG TPA: OmpA family protein [Cyclobacteriaceae bacterium]|nr:OmpA family protein [Cyclobacteriaceae bacterium]